MSNTPETPESGPDSPGAEIVPAPQADPPASSEDNPTPAPAKRRRKPTTPTEQVSVGEYARRAGQRTVSAHGETPVIVQPPPPPPEPPTGAAEENSVTKTELARQLQVSVRTVERWAEEGVLPAPIRQGRGRMATRFPADAALLYWQEQGEESRKERRARQRNRRNLPQDGLTRESQLRRNRRPGSSS